MKRRSYLSMVALPAIAGCSSQSSSTTEAGISIEESSLLSHWEDFGDVLSNQMNAVGVGGIANIGARYNIPVHDGKVEELFQVTVFNEESSVDSRTVEDTKLVRNDVQKEAYERWEGFDTTDWEQGNYTAQVIVRDEVTGENASAEFDFSINEPLGPDEVEIVDVVQPPNWEVGEADTFEISVKNTSDRDGSIVSSFSVRINDSDWQSYSDKYISNIPAGETRTEESDRESFERAGSYEFRIDDIDESWTIDVAEK